MNRQEILIKTLKELLSEYSLYELVKALKVILESDK